MIWCKACVCIWVLSILKLYVFKTLYFDYRLVLSPDFLFGWLVACYLLTFLNIALLVNAKAIGDRPLNFEQRPSAEDDALTSTSNFHANGRTLSSDRFNAHQTLYAVGLLGHLVSLSDSATPATRS
ncbi:hypothetical protein TNCV_4595981 [Trichonephila clavipes]|uniref:Uncharacterized protein n=1 Tax=Trichonephila clavipes TaxID=2585209 RepID=A0A8X6WFJ5_TRICX|nr:hypothetical protein TNCV_4595981 [Trichonephila clavipes]